jgi:AcrR family transcriptional regulator
MPSAPTITSVSKARARKGTARGRTEKSSARREAILAAAFDEFSARGFAATRIDDVARRADVAKGTIYLYFRDKEALFQELVRTMLVPLVAALEAPPPADVPIRVLLEAFIDLFVREVYSTKRRAVLRLVMTEGPRFPKLAEFHYRNVVEPAMTAMRALIERAPGIVAIIWSGLFDRFAPLDVGAMMRAHLDVLFGKESAQ